MELHVEDCAVDTPKIKFSVNKILAEHFLNNLSYDIYHSQAVIPWLAVTTVYTLYRLQVVPLIFTVTIVQGSVWAKLM